MSPATIIALSVLATLVVLALIGVLALWPMGALSPPEDSHHNHEMPAGPLEQRADESGDEDEGQLP